jgi:hypothetical protein
LPIDARPLKVHVWSSRGVNTMRPSSILTNVADRFARALANIERLEAFRARATDYGFRV